ncbi:uncharacterized protein PAF06_007638 [Gastrophryne carolinensis]
MSQQRGAVDWLHCQHTIWARSRWQRSHHGVSGCHRDRKRVTGYHWLLPFDPDDTHGIFVPYTEPNDAAPRGIRDENIMNRALANFIIVSPGRQSRDSRPVQTISHYLMKAFLQEELAPHSTCRALLSPPPSSPEGTSKDSACAVLLELSPTKYEKYMLFGEDKMKFPKLISFFTLLTITQCQDSSVSVYDLLGELRLSTSTVNGPNPNVSAIRIKSPVHLKRKESPFPPVALPADYSIFATFKIVQKMPQMPQNSWNLLQIIDGNTKQQIGLSYNNDTQTLNLFYNTMAKSLLMSTTSNYEKLFDWKWHKLAFSVTSGKAKIVLDCVEVSDVSLLEDKMPEEKGISALVDIQRLEIHCDPQRALSEQCCELYDQCGGAAELSIGANSPSCKCSHGVLGLQGSAGTQGEKGEPGETGNPGISGNLGVRGEPGAYGRIGDPGSKGEPGIKGEKGERGIPGERGDRGNPGLKGLPGADGHKGIAGPSGVWGPPGPKGEKGDEGERGFEGIPGFRGVKGDVGFPGAEGRPGRQGHKGVVGDPGEPGREGNKGEPGIIGPKGRRGSQGPQGIIGDPGLSGRDGDDGIEAYQGPQGGKGKLGNVGPKGEKGFLGLPGPEGPQGRPGVPGIKGEAGIPGRPGFIGPPGAAGHVGLTGAAGQKGRVGVQGIKGAEGQKGEKGAKGPKGQVGDTGPKGPDGLLGRRGPPGVIGARGRDGEQGLPGDPGVAGDIGPTGQKGPMFPASHVIEVCQKIVLEQMSSFAQSVRRQCASVCPLYGDVPMGAPGPVGLPGPTGQPGKPGIKGLDGEDGPEGFYGEAGDPGIQGQKGEPGEKGDKGRKGYGLVGFEGDTGPRGERGIPGLAFDGEPGLMGPRGHRGQPGHIGYTGVRGPPGPCRSAVCGVSEPTTEPKEETES